MLRRSRPLLSTHIATPCYKERSSIEPYRSKWCEFWRGRDELQRRNSFYSFFLQARVNGRPNLYRHISILNKLTSFRREWHDPSFLEGEPAEKKERWLKALLEENPRAGSRDNADVSIDAGAYLVVLRGWAKSGANAAPHKAEEWVGRLERHFQSASNSSALQPTVDHYNAVIGAWASSHESNSVVRAERWLNKLRDGNDDLRPTTESYNLFLDACSKGHSKRNEILHANALKAGDTLREMIKVHEEGEGSVRPNTDSFNFVIRAWTRCRNDMAMAEKVMDVLRLMELYQRKGGESDDPIKANTLSYCMAIDAWAVVAGLKAQASLKSMKKGGARVDDSAEYAGFEELSNAEGVLKYMHDLRDAGDRVVTPCTAAYNTIIGAHVRIANEMNIDAPLRAERVLRKMISLYEDGETDVEPDQRSYNHVIRAWAKIKRPNSGERAEWWLRHMFKEFEDTGNERIRPNVGTFNAVMEAYYHEPNTAKLEELLLELLRYEEAGDESLHANTAAFVLVIRAMLKHEELCLEDVQNKGCERALKWLDKLINREESGVPNAATTPELFIGILKTAKRSCSSSRRASRAVLRTVLETLTEFRASRHHLDANPYVWVLQIGLKALSSPVDNVARTKFIGHLVTATCEDGLVTGKFVSVLADGPVWSEGWTVEESERQTEEFFGNWPLPQSWSRNVREKGYLRLPKEADARRKRFQVQDAYG